VLPHIRALIGGLACFPALVAIHLLKLLLLRYRPLAFIVLLAIVSGTGCRQPAPLPDLRAGKQYLASIDSIKKLSPDSAQALAFRDLYFHTDAAVRNEYYTDFDRPAGRLVLYNPDGANGIVDLYRYMMNDASLTERNRAKATMSMVSMFAFAKSNADSADRYLELLRIHEVDLSDTLRARLSGSKAQIMLLRGKREEAISYMYDAMKFRALIRDTVALISAYINLANVYAGMNDQRKAIELLQHGTIYLKSRIANSYPTVLYGSMGGNYMALKIYDSALIYFRQSEQFMGDGKAIPQTAYQLHASKGECFTAIGNIDSAIQSFDKAAEFLAQAPDPETEKIAIVHSMPAYAHLRNVDRERAAVLKQINEKWGAEGDLQKLMVAYKSLSEVASTTGNYADALRYRLAFDSVSDLNVTQQQREYVARTEAQFETNKKDMKIQVQQGELQQRNNTIGLLALSAILAVILGAFFVTRARLQNSRRTARLQHEFAAQLLTATEEERGRIASDLHDGVNHELLTLKNNLEGASPATESRIDTIINSIRLISRNMHPVMLQEIGLARSIDHLAEQAMNDNSIFVSTEIKYTGSLSRAAELQVYRVVQESLTNTLKYAEAPACKISLLEANDQVTLTVRDNGKGFSVTDALDNSESFGLLGIQERARALGGKATISSSADGTIIHLVIPLQYGNRSNRR
jgi:two-component system NarL family sensor kinase